MTDFPRGKFLEALHEAAASDLHPTEWRVSNWGVASILKNANIGEYDYSSHPNRPGKFYGIDVMPRIDWQKERVALMAGEAVVMEFSLTEKEG